MIPEMIHGYNPLFYPGYRRYDQGYTFGIITRTFFRHSDPERQFVFVNPETLQSDVISSKDVFFRDPRPREGTNPVRYITWGQVQIQPYVKTLFRFTRSPWTKRDNGLSHAQTSVKGLFMTVDLCPSVNPFEQDFFDRLVALSAKRGSPFPVAICISGGWLEKHQENFEWLVNQNREGKLAITWVNHSFSHFYLSDLADTENFLLNPFTNLDLEFRAAEEGLIMRGEVAAPLMRLPGLVGDSQIASALRKYGLIPLGADAWLAKGQQPKEGSIVLVHGNGNEHEGILLAMDLLDKTDPQDWLPVNKALYAAGG